MKRIFCLAVLLLVVATQAYAQWIVNAGSTFTKFTADGSTTGIGVFAGGSYDLNLYSKRFYFRSGLIYHFDRATAKVGEMHKMSFDMHYLKLPLSFSYHIELNENNFLNPYVGGYFYCGLFGRFIDKYDWASIINTTTYGQLERFNYGLTGGIEYEFKRHYLFNVEYNIGLNNVCSETGGFPDFMKKLNSINIGLGYKF